MLRMVFFVAHHHFGHKQTKWHNANKNLAASCITFIDGTYSLLLQINPTLKGCTKRGCIMRPSRDDQTTQQYIAPMQNILHSTTSKILFDSFLSISYHPHDLNLYSNWSFVFMIREKNSFLVLIFRIKEMGGLSVYMSLLLLRHGKDSKEEKLVGSYVYSFVLECITCCKFDDDISCLMLLKFIHFTLRCTCCSIWVFELLCSNITCTYIFKYAASSNLLKL